MAHFVVEKSKSGMEFGEILLTQEDMEMFRECQHAVSCQNKAPTWSENIIKWLLEPLTK